MVDRPLCVGVDSFLQASSFLLLPSSHSTLHFFGSSLGHVLLLPFNSAIYRIHPKSHSAGFLVTQVSRETK